jgi:uncharacterized protein (TIGR02996 family)
MSRDRSFVDAVRARPDDDDLRLVYADWLEEQGDPRGPFLRAACRLRALPAGAEAAALLRARLRELRPGVAAEWLAVVCRPLAEDEVREAVFRLKFLEHNPEEVRFLQVDGGDPLPGLLERFAGERPAVRPASAAGDRVGGGIVDTATGARGVRYRVEAPRWLDDCRCEVQCSYHRGPLDAAGRIYEVKAAGDRWVAVEVTTNWIS